MAQVERIGVICSEKQREQSAVGTFASHAAYGHRV